MPRTDATSTRVAGRQEPDLGLELLDAYWRANYLSARRTYLLDNPLLREPLQAEHVKPRLLGYCGTPPGLSLRVAFDSLTGADLDDARHDTAIADTTVFALASTPRAFSGRPDQRRHRCLRRRVAYFCSAARLPGRSSSSR